MAKKRSEVRVPGPLCVCDAEGELIAGPDGGPNYAHCMKTIARNGCGHVADSIVADITIYPRTMNNG